MSGPRPAPVASTRGRTPYGGVAATLGAAVLWGTTGTAQALAPPGSGPLTVGALRIAVGAIVLLAWVLGHGGGSAVRGSFRAGRRWWVVLAGLCVAAYQVCFFTGVASTGVAVGTLIALGSAPISAGLVAWIAGERPSSGWFLATPVAVTGGIMLVLGAGDDARATPLGIGLSLAAGLAYAGYTVTARQLLLRGEAGPPLMAGMFTVGAIALAPVLVGTNLDWVGWPSGLLSMLWLGVVATGIAYLLFERGLRVLPAGTASTLALAEPLTATALGVLLLGESLSALSSAGVATLVLGILIVSREPVRDPVVPSSAQDRP